MRALCGGRPLPLPELLAACHSPSHTPPPPLPLHARSSPGNLALFTRLHTLILDKNGLPGLGGFPGFGKKK